MNKNLSTQPSKCYRQVIIIGKDWNDAFQTFATKALKEAEDDSNCFVIGDGKTDVTPDDIKKQLKGRIGPKTQIQLHVHGDQSTLKEQFFYMLGRKRSSHKVALGTMTTSTSEVVKVLTECSNGNSLNLILLSCYGGAAKGCVEYSPKGSIMITTGEPNKVTYGNTIDSDLKLPPFPTLDEVSHPQMTQLETASLQDIFLRSIHKCFETFVITFNTDKGSISYTYRPFRGKILTSVDEARRYIQSQERDFLHWCREHNILIRDYASSMTDKDVKQVLDDNTITLIYDNKSILDLPKTFDPNCMLRNSMINQENIPLFWAVFCRKPETVKFFLNRGADPNGIRGKKSPVVAAIEQKEDQSLKLLLEAKANPDGTEWGELPLSIAVLDNNLEAIKLLLDAGANPNGREEKGPPLFVAIERKNSEAIRLLLQAKADPNKTNFNNRLPLFSAIYKKDPNAVKLLLEAGAKPNEPEYGELPIFAAISEKNPEIVKLLLNAEVDPNTSNKFGNPALFAAISSQHSEIVELLLEAGADISLTWQGKTPIEYAKDVAFEPVISALLLKQLTAARQSDDQAQIEDAARKYLKHTFSDDETREKKLASIIKKNIGSTKLQARSSGLQR